MVLVEKDGTKIVDEVWKPFEYKGKVTKYEVSTFGNIRNSKTGRILKQHEQNGGYYGVTLSIDGKLHSFKTASIIAKAFIPNDDPKHKTQINHKNGRRKYDNSIYNLEWATPAENQVHAFKTGLTRQITTPSTEMIKHVCDMLQHNVSVSDIRRETNISSAIIYNILSGKNYKKISSEYDFSGREQFTSGPKRKYSDKLIHKVCKLWIKGYLAREMSEILDIPENTIYGIIYKNKYAYITSKYDFSKRKRKRRSRVKTEDLQ